MMLKSGSAVNPFYLFFGKKRYPPRYGGWNVWRDGMIAAVYLYVCVASETLGAKLNAVAEEATSEKLENLRGWKAKRGDAAAAAATLDIASVADGDRYPSKTENRNAQEFSNVQRALQTNSANMGINAPSAERGRP